MEDTIVSGWYPDPSDENALRYFDGNSWTNFVTDRPVGVSESAIPQGNAAGSGWFPDPWTSGNLRFFDGSAWTTQVQTTPPESQRSSQTHGPWSTTPSVEQASPGQRFGGYVIDNIVVFMVGGGVAGLLILVAKGFDPDATVPPAVGVLIGFGALLSATGALAVPMMQWGASPGMAVAGARVLRPDGRALGPLRCWIRSFTFIVNLSVSLLIALPNLINAGLVLFTQRRRSLNDFAADSVVIAR